MASIFMTTLFSGSTARFVVAMLLFARSWFTVAGKTGTDEKYDCRRGCRRKFQPVCGEDGTTYINACVAACQEVHIAREGPCPGETLFHLSNKHVISDDVDSPSTAPSAASSPANLITPQHLDAFRQEGFRYAGQMHFTSEMERKKHARHQQPRQQPTGAPTTSGLSSGFSQGQQLQHQQGSVRAVRVTREGHVYLADSDENVDRVLDTLIHHQQVEAAVAEQEQQQQAPSQARSLINSLQQWRAYRARKGGVGAAAAGSATKWARHTVITSTGSPADHVLQPGLDNTAASGFTAQGRSSTSPPTSHRANIGSTPQRPEQVEEAEEEEEGGISGTRVLGGSKSNREKKQQRWQDWWGTGGREGGGGEGRGVDVRRPVRRSLGIFDVDDRIDCPRIPTYPFTAVGQIDVRDPSGNYVCSGTLVGPDVVLTAAHCVFSRSAQAFYKSLDFAPSRYRTVDNVVINPFGIVNWTYVTVYQGYSSLSSPDPNVQDVAVINLAKRIGLQAGWMGVFEPCSASAPVRYVALTAGYPSDQKPGSCKTTQCVVVQDPCTDGYLYHKCDTASGQSGSPMYMMAMTSGRKMGPYIRGVHNIEWVQELPDGTQSSYINSAVSITPDHYRSILAWIGFSFVINGTTPMGPAQPPNDYMSQISG